MNNRVTEQKLFFSTPVWVNQIGNYQETNEVIFQFIKKLQNEDPDGIRKSNISGWHSPNFKLSDNEPKALVNLIAPSLQEAIIDMGWDMKSQEVKISEMWSIINKHQASNASHIHGNSFLSAAYYVRAPKDCGNIQFHDPRAAPVYHHPIIDKPNNLNSNTVAITPKEGLLVLFPSYINHSVGNNNSNEERIVISFNVTLKKI
tara:strand:+ start:194 stop:802 length:609 start_codon:yes stop_codon:yes gene_type:complete